MTTHTTTNTTTNTTKAHWMPRSRWLLLAIPAFLGAGVFAWRAHAAAREFGFGPGMGGSPEMHRMFMERRLDKALEAIKANDSQRTAVKAIFSRMATEMQPIHQQHHQLHEALASALGADTVDRAAVEKLRTQAAALFDQGSQVFAKAILDAAQVLSADQRQALIKYMQESRGRHRMGF
jgi:protein CpxP